jgi:short-subunit dehydrogenase
MKVALSRVLLTGASGGIGRSVAQALLEAGSAVMLVGRSASGLATLAAELAQQTGADASRVIWHAADLAQVESMAPLASAAAAWRCNVVVHGAGLPAFGRLQNQDAALMQRVLQTNLLAPMLLTQALLSHLQRQPRAQVICIGSALGRIGVPGYSVYGASKFGLRGFAEALRRELQDGPVRVQYLGPRATDTGFNDARVRAHNQSTGSHSDSPQRVAAELLHLLEDEAAERFIGFPEFLAVRLNGWAPALLDGAFRQHGRSLAAADTTPPVLAP